MDTYDPGESIAYKHNPQNIVKTPDSAVTTMHTQLLLSCLWLERQGSMAKDDMFDPQNDWVRICARS